jgi:hypothetical protein
MRLSLREAQDDWTLSDPTAGAGAIPRELAPEWMLPEESDVETGLAWMSESQGPQRKQAGASAWTGRVVGTWASVQRGLPAPTIDVMRDALRVPVQELRLELGKYDAALGVRGMAESAWDVALRDVFGQVKWAQVVDVAASVPMLGTLARAAWSIGLSVAALVRAGRDRRPQATGEPSQYSRVADADGFRDLVDTLADPYGDLLLFFSPPVWTEWAPPYIPQKTMLVQLNQDRDWWAWAPSYPEGRPPGLLGRGAIPGGKGVHGRVEVVRVGGGNNWRAVDSGRWQAAVTYQAPWLWEALARPGRRAFDVDALELRRRWRVYLQTLWLELQRKPGDVQTTALEYGRRMGWWLALGGPLDQAGIDDAGGVSVPCRAAMALRAAQVSTLQSVQAMLVEPQAPALQTDDELRAMADRARADILARPELLCRVDLDSIDRSQWRDVVRFQQEQRGCALFNAGGVQTSGGILVAGALAGSSIPLLPPTPEVEGTPGGAGGSPAGDVELDDEQSAGLLVAGLVAAAGLGLMMTRKRR